MMVTVGLFESVRSQSCEPYAGRPLVCNSFFEIGQPMYVPNATDMPWLESDSSRLANLMASRFTDEGSFNCRDEYFGLLCGTYFRPCLRDPSGTTLPLIIPFISSAYKNAYYLDYDTELNACLAFLEENGFPPGIGLFLPFDPRETPLRCNETDVIYGSPPLFPEGEYTQPIPTENGTWSYNLTVTCSNLGAGQLTCPEPLQRLDDLDICGFTCPLPAMTEEQYNTVQIMQGVLAWFSYVSTFFVVMSYMLHPRLRTFPSNMLAMTCLSAHILSFGLVLPTMAGYNEVWCGGDDQEYSSPELNSFSSEAFSVLRLSMNSPLCTFQGVILHFGLVSALNMIIQLYLGKKGVATGVKTIVFQAVYHTTTWGVPSLFGIILLGADKFVYESSSTFCFITSEDDLAWQLSLFFVPVGVLIVVGGILFVVAMVCIFMITAGNSKKRASTIVIHDIEEGYNKYYTCLLREEDDCSLSEDVTKYDLVLARAFCYASLGLFLAILFCHMDVWRLWWKVISAVRAGEGCAPLKALTSSSFSGSSKAKSKSKRKKERSGSSKKLEFSTSSMVLDDVVP
ncbi:Frizzled-9 [Balamuthia mandrillaris]